MKSLIIFALISTIAIQTTIDEWSTCATKNKCEFRYNCEVTDEKCKAARTLFDKCYDSSYSCNNWENYLANSADEDPINRLFASCRNECKVSNETSANFYKLVQCDCQCGGKTNCTNIEFTTVGSWKECTTNKKCQSPFRCSLTDITCQHALITYNQCYAGSKSCQAWDKYQKTSNSSSPITADFEKCKSDCLPNPKASSNLYNLALCDCGCGGANCGGVFNLATIKKWTECVSMTGVSYPFQCDETDTQCLTAQSEFAQCYATTQSCNNWVQYLSSAKDGDLVSDDYPTCHKECLPPPSLAKNFNDQVAAGCDCAGTSCGF